MCLIFCFSIVLSIQTSIFSNGMAGKPPRRFSENSFWPLAKYGDREFSSQELHELKLKGDSGTDDGEEKEKEEGEEEATSKFRGVVDRLIKRQKFINPLRKEAASKRANKNWRKAGVKANAVVKFKQILTKEEIEERTKELADTLNAARNTPWNRFMQFCERGKWRPMRYLKWALIQYLAFFGNLLSGVHETPACPALPFPSSREVEPFTNYDYTDPRHHSYWQIGAIPYKQLADDGFDESGDAALKCALEFVDKNADLLEAEEEETESDVEE